MELGYIGLGKMGFNMAERLLEKGHRIVAFDRNADALREIEKKGADTVQTIADLAFALKAPCAVWIMVPYQAVDAVLNELVPRLADGDTVIDGGNSPFRESMRRATELAAKGIGFLDAGVSGGPAGARNGACVMVGGKEAFYRKYADLFRDLATENGCRYVGSSGAGHFVKMVHNGIEYGMMQALAEGFAALQASPFGLDLTGIADLYNRRSVIESRLVGWLAAAFRQHGGELDGISGSAAQSGEGRWTVEAARELGVETPVIEASVLFREKSQTRPSFSGKVISAMRNQFGGHEVREQKD